MPKQQILRPLTLKIHEGTLDWDNKLIMFYTRKQMAKRKIQRRIIPKDHHGQFEMRRCLYACWCSFNMEQLRIMHGQGFSPELFQEWLTFPPKNRKAIGFNKGILPTILPSYCESQLDPYFWARSKESLETGGLGGGAVGSWSCDHQDKGSRTAKTALVWKHWRGIRALEKTDDEAIIKAPRWKSTEFLTDW